MITTIPVGKTNHYRAQIIRGIEFLKLGNTEKQVQDADPERIREVFNLIHRMILDRFVFLYEAKYESVSGLNTNTLKTFSIERLISAYQSIEREILPDHRLVLEKKMNDHLKTHPGMVIYLGQFKAEAASASPEKPITTYGDTW